MSYCRYWHLYDYLLILSGTFLTKMCNILMYTNWNVYYATHNIYIHLTFLLWTFQEIFVVN